MKTMAKVDSQAICPNVVIAAYKKHGSSMRAGEILGISKRKVLEILSANGHHCNSRKWTPQEIEKLKRMYPDCSKTIEEIAVAIQRTPEAVSLKANRLKIASDRFANRHTDSVKMQMSQSQKKYYDRISEAEKISRSECQKKYIRKNGHPRGMLGKKHSEATKKVIGEKGLGRAVSIETIEKSARTKVARYGKVGNDISRLNSSWKAGWRDVGGKNVYFRSRWEANYARYLDWLKTVGDIIDWEHEPETFWFSGVKRGCVSYLPDFKVTEKNGSIAFHEVKGWMDDRSKTKIKRMAKYYPKVKLVVIDATHYKKLHSQLKGMISGWES